MDLLEYLGVIRRRWQQIIALAAILILLTVAGTSIYGGTRYRAELFITTASQDTSNTSDYRFSNYYNEFSANNFNNTIIGWFDDPSLTHDTYKKAEVDMNSNLDFWQKFTKPLAAKKRERNNVSVSLTARSEHSAQQLSAGLFTVLQEKVIRYNEASGSRYQIIKQGEFISLQKPNLGFNMILALLIGLILGVIVVYIYEYAAGKISYASQGEDILGMKNLAVVCGWDDTEWRFIHALSKKLNTSHAVLVGFADRKQVIQKTLSSHRLLPFPAQANEILQLAEAPFLVFYRLSHTSQEQLQRLLHILNKTQIKPIAING